MALFLKSGTSYRVTNKESMDLHELLPAGNYVIKKDPMSGQLYLEGIDNFEIRGKIYGDTEKTARRILNTFQDRSASTGVMLTGEKGSGKSLLAKMLSVKAADTGVPTIVINAPWSGDEFNSFLQKIDQPCVILFDEFEKVYDYQTQNKILTLFDGVYPTKKLFVLTTNDSHSVNSFLKNRPGRIYYTFKFDTLDQVFIEEYCNDNLIDKTQTQSILKYTSIFSFFNFDMLAAAVEEMNRYGETLQEVLNYLNIIPENKASETYTISFTIGNFTKVLEKSYRGFSPNNFDYYVLVEDELKELKEQDPKMYSLLERNFAEPDFEGNKEILYNQSNLVQFDPSTNVFTYTVERGGVEAVLNVERVVNISSDLKKYGVLF